MIVQATLLFGSEAWVINPRIGSTLRGFHHRVDCYLEGMQLKRDMPGRWEYPPLDAAMAEVGLKDVETYVLHC